MNTESFLLLFTQNPQPYFIVLAIVAILCVPLFLKFCNSIIDPFFFALVNAVFAYTVPIYLYVVGECPEKHLYYFLISESVFWLVIFLYPNKRKYFRGKALDGEEVYAKVFFKIAFFIYILTTLCTYVLVGIPLFMQSRLDLYTGTGLGFLDHFSSFAQSYVILYSFYQMHSRKNKKYALSFSFVILTSLLSGSKGSILTLLNWYFIYYYFFLGRKVNIKLKYLLPILGFPILVLLLYKGSASGSIGQAFLDLMFRFVANGDGYWMSYPEDTIRFIHINNPILHLFSALLAPLRLISYDVIQPVIGVLLYWMQYPTEYGTTAGPNARLAITGWCYFRWYGILFSATAGLIVGYCLYTSKKYLSRSIFGIFLYGMLYLSAISFFVDPSMFFGHLVTLLVNLIMYSFFIMLLSRIRVVNRK